MTRKEQDEFKMAERQTIALEKIAKELARISDILKYDFNTK